MNNSDTKMIGFWKNGEHGYLSSPLCYKDGKPVRLRLIKNRYASNEKNRPSYIAFVDKESLDDILASIEADYELSDEKEAVWEPVYDSFYGSVYPPIGFKCPECGFKAISQEKYCAGCGAHMV